jgi:hypothetical protein
MIRGPLTRHEFLIATLGVVSSLMPAYRALAQEKSVLQVDVAVDRDEAAQVIEMLKLAGAEKPEKLESRGLAGVETVVIAGLIASALSTVVIKLAAFWKCAIVVDASRSRVQAQKSCDLSPGTVLIKKPGGMETKLSNPSEKQVETVLAALPK